MPQPRTWEGMRTQIEEILERRTGEGVEAWNAKIAGRKPTSEGELRAWLTEQGVIGYPQMLLAMETFGYPDYLLAGADELIDGQYADRPHLRPVLDALLVAAPSLIAPHPFTESAAYVAGLTNFDSIWGLVLAELAGMGIAGADGVIAAVSAAGLIGMYAWALVRTRGSDLARSSALALIAVLLWTRLYSPQYSLWLVPFFALGALPLRAFALLTLADVIVFLTVYPLTLVRWDPADSAQSLLFGALAAGIVLRHIALIAAWRAGAGGSGYGRAEMPRVAPTA